MEKSYKLYLGDALSVLSNLKEFPDNSIDSVITDPPYGLQFMNQKWDYDVPSVKLWREVLRVLKPGGHLLSFFGTRTYHRGVVNLEDAGFEIRDMIQWLYGCVSEDTAILTTKGWKKWNELEKGDLVFTFNIKTEKIEVQPVEEKFVYLHNGKMVNLKNNNTNQLLTLNHKVIVKEFWREQHNGIRRYYEPSSWSWRFAAQIKNYGRYKLPLGAIYDGYLSIGEGLAELIGWILSEGHIQHNQDTIAINIYQTSTNKEKVEHIAQLLDRLKVNYSLYERKKKYKDKEYIEYQWYIPETKNKELINRILELIPNKKPSWKLLHLTYEEKLALFNSLMMGDGCKNERGKYISFYQNDTEFLEWFQILCHLIGLQARINYKKHYVSVHYNPTTELQARHLKDRFVEYSGIVWSIKTKNMTYFARRNGKIFITGNSGFPKSMDISKAIDKGLGKLEEREVIGVSPKQPAGYIRHGRTDEEVFFGTDNNRTPALVTAPATLEAEKWQGWGTSLKPACEPIVLARKPISERNIAQNVLKWGCGGLNIDACRIGVGTGETRIVHYPNIKGDNYGQGKKLYKEVGTVEYIVEDKGRFPANVILDEQAAKMLDKQSGVSKSTKPKNPDNRTIFRKDGYVSVSGLHSPENSYNDKGGASRFFYVAKAGRDERFGYCQTCEEVIPQKEWQKHRDHNLIFHTTVKPLKLMEYLVRLVTPNDGVVLDPFMGTGTTGIAALKQGFKFIGIEINENYYKIAKHRLKYYEQPNLSRWLNKKDS